MMMMNNESSPTGTSSHERATHTAPSAGPRFDPATIERPDRALLSYYLWVSAMTFIAFPFVFLGFYLRYRTLKYRFDDKGVSMSVGVLFRKEVYLTYRRIQDIHVKRNLFHRWLGLSEVAIQTASGAAGAEMTIEGLRDPEGLREYLYTRMRGATDPAAEQAATAPDARNAGEGRANDDAPDEALVLLREIRDELRAVRQMQTTTPGGEE